jgi:aspartate carbamoyltransferase catalytic subunit
MSRIPVIQADIYGQQSQTQDFIDLYTIYKELIYRGIDMNSNSREVIHVTFLGFTEHSQSSLLYHLDLFPKIECHFVSDLKDEGTQQTDILYVSPKQNEEKYCVDKEFLSKTKATMILMHPLPRKDEILQEVDTNPRSVYFHQSENGIYVRMAILDTLFSVRSYPTMSEYFWLFMATLRSIFTLNLFGSFNFGT